MPAIFYSLSKTRLALSILILVIIIATAVSAVLVFNSAQKEQVESMRSRVSTLALAVSTDDIVSLSGTEDDVRTLNYKHLKEKLIKLKDVNTDIKFVYLMGQKQEQIYFIADSEDPTSEDYSPPGQIYEEATESLKLAFLGEGPMQEVSSDRWGNWLSVFAPITDANTNQVIAIAGFDLPYQKYMSTIVLSTAVPVAIGIFIILLLIGAWLVAKQDENILHLKSEYFSIAAHDLRTPLTGIKWAIMALSNSKPTAPPHYQNVFKEITKTADNMILSVNELLDSSSLESGKANQLIVGPIKIQDLMADAFRPLEISAKEKSVEVIWEIPKQSLVIQGDSDKLRRVFANLFSNAIKYSNEGGAVFVSVKADGGIVTIKVSDSGIGIPKAEQAKVFDGYFRASNAKQHTAQGRGLGLYYVKNVVITHGGDISLDSSPERDTTITTKLPLKK